MRNMYIDDCLASVDTEDKAMSLIKDMIDLCKKEGFRLTKWINKCTEILKSVSEDDIADDIKKLGLNGETLIGLPWGCTGLFRMFFGISIWHKGPTNNKTRKSIRDGFHLRSSRHCIIICDDSQIFAATAV